MKIKARDLTVAHRIPSWWVGCPPVTIDEIRMRVDPDDPRQLLAVTVVLEEGTIRFYEPGELVDVVDPE